jgi:hypothetical protein
LGSGPDRDAALSPSPIPYSPLPIPQSLARERLDGRGCCDHDHFGKVRVNGDLLEADKIIVNTGGRAFLPEGPGLDRIPRTDRFRIELTNSMQ